MCGICGVIGADRHATMPAIKRMMRAMVHRGPDDEGSILLPMAGDSGPLLGLGFRRLAILDLSTASRQPMVNPETGDCIVFNGEIYNFKEMRSELRLKGVSFQTAGDTEVLLKALSVWGEAALQRLDGMYAFAFYEASTRRVLLARDHVGIKPLYISARAGCMVFASEVRAVLASGLVPDDLDQAGIAGVLAYGSPQDPLTIHRHVRSIQAGCCVWLHADDLAHSALRSRRYWRFPSVQPQGDVNASIADVHSRLMEAVSQQCVADVPLASFLSGGVDSAAIAALAVRGNPGLRTFCVGFEGEEQVDETAFAAKTAKALGTQHYQTILDSDWMVSFWREWLGDADRPSVDGLNTYVVSNAIKDSGVTVALSGVGADEVFGGYRHFVTIPRSAHRLRHLEYVPRSFRTRIAGVLLCGLPENARISLLSIASAAATPVGVLLRLRRIMQPSELARLTASPDRLGLTRDYLLPEVAAEVAQVADTDVFHIISRIEMMLYMQNTLLRDADVNSMAHSLELRVPFLGRRFIEFVASLSSGVVAPSSKEPKYLLRESMRRDLPSEVFTRPKVGFTLPVGEWMRGRLREQCEIAVRHTASESGLNGDEVMRTWNDFVAGRRRMHWIKPLAFVVLGSYLLNRKSASAV
jgi:asparagine synthase (glutamine-hydrolysing)